MITITTSATLLTAESRPYSIEGNEGVSHKARVNVDGEIYSLRTTEELVKELKNHLGEEGEAEIVFSSRKENLKAELVSFTF